MELSKRTIFLADDDPDDRFLIKSAIHEVLGLIEILEAEDGEELLQQIEIYQGPAISLVILDMNMPKRNGLETLRLLRKDLCFDPLPVVMVSTATNPDLIDQAYQNGVTSYYTKPVSFQGYIELADQLVKECLL